MIVKMRKFNFLIYHKAYHSFIEKIMDAGVVHINEKQTGIPDDAENLLAFIHTAKRLKHAISYLNKIKLKKVKTTQPVGVDNGMLLLEETENLNIVGSLKNTTYCMTLTIEISLEFT